MDQKLNYNFIDILWAPARAFSPKKILVMTFYCVAALVIFDVFTYLSIAVSGGKTDVIFSVYNFFPFIIPPFTSLFPKIVYWLGCMLATLSVMLGFYGVSLIEIEAIRGNRFYSGLRAIKAAFTNLRQIFLAELGIGMFIVFVVVLFAIVGLISRIPYLGDWLYTILFIIPLFLASIITVFIIMILQLSVVLLPATSAADKKKEAFQAILETFSTLIRQPLRWIFYTAYAVVTGKVCSFVYAYFCYRAIQFTAWGTSLGGGERMKEIVQDSLTHLPVRSELTAQMLNLLPGINFGIDLSRYSQATVSEPVSYLMALMLFLIFSTVVGYFFSVIATTQARGYAVIRYLKDGYKIEDEDPV